MQWQIGRWSERIERGKFQVKRIQNKSVERNSNYEWRVEDFETWTVNKRFGSFKKWRRITELVVGRTNEKRSVFAENKRVGGTDKHNDRRTWCVEKMSK